MADLTRLGLGTWAWGGGGWAYGWGRQDEKSCVDTLETALSLGISWVDTAPVYGLGRAETILGKAMKVLKVRPFVATKCGLAWNEKRKVFPCLSKKSVLDEAEQSLRRLGVDMIDLYQIHWPVPEKDIEEAWDTVEELRLKGWIRFAGVSNFSLEQLTRVHRIHPVSTLQPPYSMFMRDIDADLLPFCQKKGIGVLTYSPMQKGMLTDKFTREWVAGLPSDDHRTRDPMFKEPRLSDNLRTVSSLKTIANECGLSLSQLAIAWCLRSGAVTSAIVGARTPMQIRETAGIVNVRLEEGVIEQVNRILDGRTG